MLKICIIITSNSIMTGSLRDQCLLINIGVAVIRLLHPHHIFLSFTFRVS